MSFSAASAADMIPINTNVPNVVGMGVGMLPDYKGSDGTIKKSVTGT